MFFNRKVRVTYINGIRTPEAECKDHARMLADLFGVPCYALWNKTAGAWADFSQAARQKVFSADTEEVLQLAVHLTQQLEAVGCNGRLVHIAHSQGALITSLCRRHLTIEQRARIKVIVLGGAASISNRQYGTCVNYYCSNEPMLYIDGRASRAWRQVQAGVDSCKQVGIDTRLPPPATAPPQAPVQRRGGAHARRKTGEEATQMTRSSPGLSQGHTPGQHKGRDDNAESQGRECNAAHPHPPSHGKGKREEAVEKERTRSWWNSVQDTVGSGPWNTCNPPQMAAGGVGAALVEGAAFVFLQPVHKGTFGGMEDHLITNHAYLLALHFEAQVFRQGHLSLWHRVTLRPIPPLHHLLPIPTAGAVHVAALKEATASAAFSWLKTKIARGKVHHTQVARGKVHHFQGAHLGGGDARPSGRGTSQTKTHGTSQTNTPASSQTPSRSQRSQTRTSSLTLPPAPNPLSHHPLAPATNILDEGVGTLGPLASHVSPASDVPLASDTPVQALASHTLGLGPFGLHRLGPLALDGLRLGPLAVVLPSAHEHAAEGTLCRATQDSSSCWDVVGVETGAVDALFAVDTPLPAAPNPFLEHVAVGSGPASRTSASERPMPAGTGPQIVPVTDAIARDGTRDGTRHSRASRLMHLSRL